MKRCFLCSKGIAHSEHIGVFRLGKEGLIIPPGMRKGDAICNDCYSREKAQYKRSTPHGNIISKGLQYGKGKMTPETFMKMVEQFRLHGHQMIDENEPYFVEKLENRYPTIKNELQRLLSPYVINETDHIGSALQCILEHEKAVNYPMRDYELDKLDFFLRNLKDIESYDNTTFDIFKQKVINALPKGDFFGVRLEVMMCSTFIINRLNFRPIPESPPDSTVDFVIHGNSDIFVECTSTHLEERREGDLTFKIKRTLTGKSFKPYANPNTALFIDATNIFYHSMLNASKIDKDLQDNLTKTLEDTTFGSVIIFRYIFENRPTRTLTHGHYRFDNKTIDSELLTFLNANFPLGNYHVDRFYQPSRG